MIKELSEIYYSISDFCKSVDLRPTDDCMLREVMTNWRGEQISKMRNNNPIKKGMSESRVLAGKKGVVENKQSVSSPKPSKLPATEPQLKYIYKSNLDVDTKNLTKKEAFQIIKKHKEKKK